MSTRKSTLEKIPLFPFSNFLRINGEMQHNSECGGIASIIAIGLILAILVMKLVEVFKMETLITSSQTKVQLEPPMANVSTVQNSDSTFPYMMALGYYQDPGNPSSAAPFAYYVTRIGGLNDPSAVTTMESIPLQSCTTQHFSVIPGIADKASTWGLSDWKCLPLNKTWQIGGDYQLSTVFKRIQVNVTCLTTSNYADCGYYKLYSLNSFINPKDIKSPSTYYISSDSFLIKGYSYLEYSSKLDSNILVTDTTVLPSQKLTTVVSMQANLIQSQRKMNIAPLVQTILKIEKSPRTSTYKRTFLKLLDAIAYVGGIFNSILAVFFFMSLYGRFYFQMKFAEYYFNSKETRGVGFFSWIKQALYNVLARTPCKPQWQYAQQRNKYQQTVNKMLDIFYLHKRIAFLELAHSILIDRHQRKGLHLIPSANQVQSKEKYDHYRIRDRVMVYLHKYTHDQVLGGLDEDQERQKEIGESQKGLKNGLKIDDIEIIKGKNQMQEITNEGEYAPEAIEAGEMKQVKDIIQNQIRNIGPMNEEELNQEELVKDIEQDLRKLFQQGQRKKDPNLTSKRICQKLQTWLKKGLKMAYKKSILEKNLFSI